MQWRDGGWSARLASNLTAGSRLRLFQSVLGLLGRPAPPADEAVDATAHQGIVELDLRALELARERGALARQFHHAHAAQRPYHQMTPASCSATSSASIGFSFEPLDRSLCNLADVAAVV